MLRNRTETPTTPLPPPPPPPLPLLPHQPPPTSARHSRRHHNPSTTTPKTPPLPSTDHHLTTTTTVAELKNPPQQPPGSNKPTKDPPSLSTSQLYHGAPTDSAATIAAAPCNSSASSSVHCDARKDSRAREDLVNSCRSLSVNGMGGGGARKPHRENDQRWAAIREVLARDGYVGPGHFRLLRKVGSGDIGTVYVAGLHGGGGERFAMKVVEKEVVRVRGKEGRAETEREILRCLDHPFLPTLYAHYETERYWCLVMEFCPGGDLHGLRQGQPDRRFSEKAARFYVAEVLLALEYLHMLGIIYRDLKPENVLVRADGHIMLSDFDLSLRCPEPSSPALLPSLTAHGHSSSHSRHRQRRAHPYPSCTCRGGGLSGCLFSPPLRRPVPPPHELVVEPTAARSMSFVGTHEYLAPEVIKGEGHGSAVDWWTLGVFLYELLFGRTPFKGSGNRVTLFNVVGKPLRFPKTPTVSLAARDLIRVLLAKEPEGRLGYRRGAAEVRQHPFFHGVIWALIRCAVPPEVPTTPTEMEGRRGA